SKCELRPSDRGVTEAVHWVDRGYEFPEHREEERRRERDADPEAPRHVDELRVLALLRLRLERLERHAADRTRPRSVAADLGMHRACPDRSPLRGRSCRLRSRQIR